MDHEFELAFNLCDEAAGRIREQRYGITRLPAHHYGEVTLTAVHHRTPDGGHRLVLLATDAHGQLAAIEATAPERYARPATRIVKVRTGDLTFHVLPHDPWAWRATAAGHSYLLMALTPDDLEDPDDPEWLTTIDHHAPVGHYALDGAVDCLLAHREPRAA